MLFAEEKIVKRIKQVLKTMRSDVLSEGKTQ